MSTLDTAVTERDSEAADSVVYITRYQQANRPKGTPEVLRWGQLAAELQQHRVSAQKDGPMWNPVRLDPDRPHRANENVEGIWCVVSDVDDHTPPEEFLSPLRAAGIEYVAYTSYSHQPGAWRFRVVVPLTREVSPKDWPQVWRGFAARFGGNHLDPGCCDVSRAYYLPAVPPLPRDWEPWFERHQGRPLDPEELKAAAPALAPERPRLALTLPTPGDRPPADKLIAAVMKRRNEFGRHRVGLNLAVQCRANDYSDAEAEAVMLDLQRQLENDGDHPYTEREALASLAWAYSKVPLERWEPLRNGNAKLAHIAAAGPAPEEAAALVADPRADDEMDEAAAIAEPGEDEKNALKLKDDTVARRWAAANRKRFMFLDGGQWWQYNKECWRYAGSDVAETQMIQFLRGLRKEHADQDVTPKRAKDALSLARADLGPVMPDDLNPRKDWIPLANGVYDTTAGKLHEHDPAHRITSCRAYCFDMAADCPLWKQFLQQTVIDHAGSPCEAWIGAIQEWFGYCLTADQNRAQSCMVWIGEGGNGKGVATRVLEKLVGEANHLAVSIERLGEPYHRAALLGKLVGFINEPDRQAMRKGGDTVKAITGGDPIEARNPCERVFTFRPTVRLHISCNHLPASGDTSWGYFRRLVLIDWRYRVPDDKIDRTLDDQLAAELPGIFNWAVAGLNRFRERGYRFAELRESDEMRAEYRKSQDELAQWLEERCAKSEEITPVDTLFRDYVRWCGLSEYRPANKDLFSKRLTKHGYPTEFGQAEGKNVRGRMVNLRPTGDESASSTGSTGSPRLFQ